MIGQRFGNYVVVRQIGKGAMGVVFEALQEQIGRRVAIKVLHPGFTQDPQTGARFLNEARAANLVQHPGVVAIFDFGQTPQGAFLVMEYLNGDSLRERLDRIGKLPIAAALRLLRQLADTLAAAHQKGIVHRDLKPENVMLVPEPAVPGGERAKVLDFGIAKLAAEQSARLTRSGTILGTPAYMAPEQCRGSDLVDDKADVYALGVMLYEMLAGQVPFAATQPLSLMFSQITALPRPIRELEPAVPEEVAGLLQRMQVKDPAARPTMAEVAREAERLPDGRGTDLGNTETQQRAVPVSAKTPGLRGPSPASSNPSAGFPRFRATSPAFGSPGAAFVVRATRANASYNYLLIDHPATTGRPEAILLVTPVGGPGAPYNNHNHHLGVWYRGDGLWSIYNQDLAPMADGATFHVVVPEARECAFVHQADAGNIVNNWTLLDHPEVSARPAALLLITPNWSPPSQLNVYNNHATGVWYTESAQRSGAPSIEGKWSIYNQDRVAMPAGTAFNVLVSGQTLLHRVTEANLLGGSGTWIDHPAATGQPGAIVLVTSNWNPGGLGGLYHDHPIGVYYARGRWAIVNQDLAPMTIGATFNVWAGPPL